MEMREFRRNVEMVLAEHARRNYPPEIRIIDGKVASDEDLLEAERTLSVRLPDKYKEVMASFGGGMFGFVDLLEVRSSDGDGGDLISENVGVYAVPNFVVIAPVGTGDMWGFVVRDRVCEEQVSMWLHDTGEIIFEYDDFLEFVNSRGLRQA